MIGGPVSIAGVGIASPLGIGIDETCDALKKGRSGLRLLGLFPSPEGARYPVGEIAGPEDSGDMPRTHWLARMAAEEAMAGSPEPPDAVVVGTTTGGILATESGLRDKVSDPLAYRFHGAGTVAADLASRLGCRGPVMTVSTACSSGGAAIAIAMAMIRSGRARRVLAGGADSLCRLTYHGFRSFQLVDPAGARPLDRNRRGLSVAEGAAMLLLVSDDQSIGASLLGGGLSCDAFHPTAPEPEGGGALAAMKAALADAGLVPSDVDYVNLHGTGTVDNDRSEAAAVINLFGDRLPPVSSIKGATGHSLAAAGAIEAVVSALCIRESLIPANLGCRDVDPEIKLAPVRHPLVTPVHTVLSNSFGFGGNNAALIIGDTRAPEPIKHRETPRFRVLGSACITGAGHTGDTFTTLGAGKPVADCLPVADICRDLAPRAIRRLKRMPRLGMALAAGAVASAGTGLAPSAIFLGTGWGGVTDTHDFLTGLFDSDEQFPSPTDFVGSVHNAAAGHIALAYGARGANITMTDGDASFEHALAVAGMTSNDETDTVLVVGADEYHPTLSGLFDPSVRTARRAADGGGALLLRARAEYGPFIRFLFSGAGGSEGIDRLVDHLDGPETIRNRYGALLVGLPAADRNEGVRQLDAFVSACRYSGPIIDYRSLTGEFATASAVGAVMAVHFVEADRVPEALCGSRPPGLQGSGCLVLGLGRVITAMEVMPK